MIGSLQGGVGAHRLSLRSVPQWAWNWVAMKLVKHDFHAYVMRRHQASLQECQSAYGSLFAYKTIQPRPGGRLRRSYGLLPSFDMGSDPLLLADVVASCVHSRGANRQPTAGGGVFTCAY